MWPASTSRTGGFACGRVKRARTAVSAVFRSLFSQSRSSGDGGLLEASRASRPKRMVEGEPHAHLGVRKLVDPSPVSCAAFRERVLVVLVRGVEDLEHTVPTGRSLSEGQAVGLEI